MAINICDAASVSVLGDGADWIWNHARPMRLELGLEPEKIFELIDLVPCREWYLDAVHASDKMVEAPPD